MLWETSKMEQRYDAVLGVLRDGFSVTEAARKFGVSRQSVHTWLQRYEDGVLEALAEQVVATPDLAHADRRRDRGARR